MEAELVAKYLTQLRKKTGLTYDAIADKSNRSESTVKKLCNGQTEDPRVDTVAPVVYALGGSMDEMLNPGMHNDSQNDIFLRQIQIMQETHNRQIETQAAQYEQRIDELKAHNKRIEEQYEKRLADKRDHMDTLITDKKWFKIAAVVSAVAMFGLFIFIESITPGHGWFQY